MLSVEINLHCQSPFSDSSNLWNFMLSKFETGWKLSSLKHHFLKLMWNWHMVSQNARLKILHAQSASVYVSESDFV